MRLLLGNAQLKAIVSFAFGLLLAVIETSITATALVSIGEYFGDPIKVHFQTPALGRRSTY